jgi:hypothetical protein
MQLETFGAVCDAIAVAFESVEKLSTSVAKAELHFRHEKLIEAWEAEELVLEDGSECIVHGFAG